jgi:hypothetical protein
MFQLLTLPSLLFSFGDLTTVALRSRPELRGAVCAAFSHLRHLMLAPGLPPCPPQAERFLALWFPLMLGFALPLLLSYGVESAARRSFLRAAGHRGPAPGGLRPHWLLSLLAALTRLAWGCAQQ